MLESKNSLFTYRQQSEFQESNEVKVVYDTPVVNEKFSFLGMKLSRVGTFTNHVQPKISNHAEQKKIARDSTYELLNFQNLMILWIQRHFQ